MHRTKLIAEKNSVAFPETRDTSQDSRLAAEPEAANRDSISAAGDPQAYWAYHSEQRAAQRAAARQSLVGGQQARGYQHLRYR